MFQELISYFPRLELPLVLQEGAEHQFSTNDGLPDQLLVELILPCLDFQPDEFTEYLPCGHWKTTDHNTICIIWVARLMRYSFYLISFNSRHEHVESLEVAGFFSDNEFLIRRMANIDEEGTITIVEGAHKINEKEFDLNLNRKLLLEIAQDGSLIKMPT